LVLVLVIVYFGFGFGFGYLKTLVVFTGFGFVLPSLVVTFALNGNISFSALVTQYTIFRDFLSFKNQTTQQGLSFSLKF